MSLSYSWNYKLSTCTLSLRDAHCMHSTYTLSFMNTEYSSHDYDLYSITHRKIMIYIGSGRAFCREIGSFCLKNKSRIFVYGIIYNNETKEQTFLFLLVLM